MSRAEHLRWAKDRALQYIERGEATKAWASMISDLHKHPELESHVGLDIGTQMVVAGLLRTPEQFKRWIEDFN